MIMMNKETPFAVKAKGVFMIVTDRDQASVRRRMIS